MADHPRRVGHQVGPVPCRLGHCWQPRLQLPQLIAARVRLAAGGEPDRQVLQRGDGLGELRWAGACAAQAGPQGGRRPGRVHTRAAAAVGGAGPEGAAPAVAPKDPGSSAIPPVADSAGAPGPPDGSAGVLATAPASGRSTLATGRGTISAWSPEPVSAAADVTMA